MEPEPELSLQRQIEWSLEPQDELGQCLEKGRERSKKSGLEQLGFKATRKEGKIEES